MRLVYANIAGLTVILTSGVIGYAVDTHLHIKDPMIYWIIGSMGGILATIAMVEVLYQTQRRELWK